MADQLYMTINEDWLFDDDMNDYTATGWSVGTNGNVVQEAGAVVINASTGNDALIKFTPEKVLPYTIDTVVKTAGPNQRFRVDNGTERLWVNFPDTGGGPKYYRLIIRAYNTRPGSISLYENGKLIKDKADLLESTTFNSIYYYNSGGSTSGEFMVVYHHRHAWGVDLGAPTSPSMTDTIYLDGRDGFTLLFNRNGAQMAPIEIIEDDIPFEAGSVYRQTNIQAKTLSLGLMISASSQTELNDKKRRLESVLGSGAVKLYAKMSDGYRYLICRYSGGLEGTENRDTSGATFQKYVVSFRAFYPFWQVANNTISIFGHTHGFTFSNGIITNNSNAPDCYPEFFISGPGTNPKLQNLTTGKSFQLNVVLGATDYLYVNTRPGERTIRDKTGAVVWDKLSTGLNQFWSLIPGENAIQIDFASGVDTTTLTRIFHREAHWGT